MGDCVSFVLRYLLSLTFEQGEASAGVEPTLLCFVNHGCNGSYNMGHETAFTEQTARLEDAYDPLHEIYQPTLDRLILDSPHHERTLRDIEAGDELLDNYLAFADEDDFLEHVRELVAMCNGEMGRVMAYETTATQDDDDSSQ